MSEPRAFKLRQAENRPSNYAGILPEIDKKRATAVLVRQSKDGADTAQAESRETQLGLQDYGKLLYGNDEPDVRLYDEGSGVSGQKRIDQRQKLDQLYQDINKGIIGTIVLAREDRLFRNKHMDQVGVFTKLADEKKIKLIVPPISSVARYDETRVYDQQSEDFVSIHEQLKGLEVQLSENAEKRLATSSKDPLYTKLQKQADELLHTKEQLETKKDKLGIIDSPEEIAKLHSLLGNFEAVWPTFDLEQRQRAFSLLVNRIEVEVVSPHWLRLSLDWLDAVCPRIDIAYLWKVTPKRGDILSAEETALLREYWPLASRLEILKLLPTRTWRGLQRHASVNHLYRLHSIREDIPLFACFLDFMPKLDGQYLFRDYETTLQYVKIACDNTAREEAPLYALWLLSEKVEGLASLLEGDLDMSATALVRPNKSIYGLEVSSVRKKMKSKGFAAGVNRDDLVKGAELLEVDLNEHIAFVIEAMSSVAETLGLAGTQEVAPTGLS